MLQQETITLKAVLDWMETGAPFSMAWITDDEKRKTGGEWLEASNVCKFDAFTKEEQARLDRAQPKVAMLKDPNHYENSTRNIVWPNGEIRTIAIRLIRRFDLPGVEDLFDNGKIVM